MRRIPLCLVVPFVLACGSGPFEVEPDQVTIRVQGTVRAADNGTPVAGAEVEMWQPCGEGGCPRFFAVVFTDTSGFYSFSVTVQESTCEDREFGISASAEGFLPLSLDGNTGIRCTDDSVQTMHFRLERR